MRCPVGRLPRFLCLTGVTAHDLARRDWASASQIQRVWRVYARRSWVWDAERLLLHRS